ncbi:hypothetical protein [Lysinibacter cavernae]|uniref:hypothetical protein n=1 Tax=Lysinibacter cavernae TaxID=1640652 RepID=UPI00361F948E
MNANNSSLGQPRKQKGSPHGAGGMYDVRLRSAPTSQLQPSDKESAPGSVQKVPVTSHPYELDGDRVLDVFEALLSTLESEINFLGRLPLPNESPSGQWLRRIREEDQAKTLSEEQIELLQNLIPSWRDSARKSWNQNLKKYKQAVRENNGYHPAADTPEGKWVNQMRLELELGDLSAAQVRWMEAEGLGSKFAATLELQKEKVEWEERRGSPWNKREAIFVSKAEALGDYVREHGVPPPLSHPIGAWHARAVVSSQAGTLTAIQQDALNENVPGWEGIRIEPRQFASYLDDLANEIDRLGRLPVARESSSGRWLHDLRYNARKGRLSQAKMDLLDLRVPNWLETTNDSAWNRRVDEYRRALVELDGKHPAYTTREGKWRNESRHLERRGSLSPARLADLRSLGIPTTG